jgi:hypothetical protein
MIERADSSVRESEGADVGREEQAASVERMDGGGKANQVEVDRWACQAASAAE